MSQNKPLEKAEEYLRIIKSKGDSGTGVNILNDLVQEAELLVAEIDRLHLCIDGVQKRYLEAEKLGLARITEGLVLEEENVEWVVNCGGELGVKIGDQLFFMYKGRSLSYKKDEDREEPMLWRPVYKREFGETAQVPPRTEYSTDRGDYDNDTGRYTFGEGWKELP